MRIVLFSPGTLAAFVYLLLIPLNSMSGTRSLSFSRLTLKTAPRGEGGPRNRFPLTFRPRLSPRCPVPGPYVTRFVAINYIDLYRLRIVNGGSERARPGDALWSFSSPPPFSPLPRSTIFLSLFFSLFYSAPLSVLRRRSENLKKAGASRIAQKYIKPDRRHKSLGPM